MSARKQLPIGQRHANGCRGRDCGCPWSFRVQLLDGTRPRVTRDSHPEAEQADHELMARHPQPLADRTTTIARWSERWLAAGRAINGAEWRPNTAARCGASVRNYIVRISAIVS